MTTTCTAAECLRPQTARQFCLMHYKRFRRWGDPLIRRPTTPPADRFWSRVDKTADCWVWTAGSTKQGYGGFHPTKGLMVLAHRWAFESLVGPIPAGLVIDHLCRNRKCVNPDHLEPVTNEENLRRGAGYGVQNGMRTTCVNGHEYTDQNTYRDPQGGIRCRQCARDRDTQRRAS